MKALHKFTVSVPTTFEKTESVVRDGQTIKETKTVTENVDHIFVLKDMTRSEKDAARLFNGASIKRAIDAGLITKAVLVQKHIDGNGSLISQETARRIVELTEKSQAIKDEILALGLVKDDEEKKAKQLDLLVALDEANRELRAIEGSNQAVFGATAENYASERSNLWIMLNQTYIEKNGKPEPFFPGAKFEDKEKALEEFENSENKLFFAAVERLSIYWGYYLGGLVNTPEDFVELDKRLAEDEERAKKEAAAQKEAEVAEGLKPAEVVPA